MKTIKSAGVALGLLLTQIVSAQQDYRVQIGLDAPASGINMNMNFIGSGGWSRGYRISNQDGSQTFIMLGSYGNHSNGISSEKFSYIGKNFDKTYMVFQPDGNIGVGTTVVENNEGWHRAFQVNGEGHAKMLVTTGVVRSGLWSHESGYYGAVAGGIVGTHTNHPFSIITNGASKVTVLANGYTGIGTTTPTERLAVNGNIRAKEIKVEAANWPDYVFKKDYELKPLSELQSYIEEHGHLPDMPKAAEAEKEGVSLGEMNKLLLKKVEELTLYILQMQKNSEVQQVQINQLLLQKK
ncbi:MULTISPECIES: hypothetical protein [unclassified Sphingobacterium]|uniref:hypothetical protein n=1 Tax=unclassified Sphingobacterium TaxID=2609468 RepID=UPI0025DB1024|nr:MULTISPECIES: hypothetical protein [unclassified Sphingobacterium]